MRTASILLALVVLGCCREAGARELSAVQYTISIGGQTFGFGDWYKDFDQRHYVFLGPLGKHHVPFTATQGLIGSCLILALLIVLPAVFAVWWKRRTSA